MITFDCKLARDRFTLDVAFASDARVIALFGASGSGKSTALRLIAGLDRPQRGHVTLDGRTLVDTSAGIHVPAHQRRIGFVFQDGHLLPHLTVGQNLDYGVRLSSAPSQARPDRTQLIETLGIGGLLQARPATLSGGERQRVALGRALLPGPDLVLMDEPLASLDQGRRLDILRLIEDLRDTLGVRLIYVSHAIEEVARIATYVVQLDHGRVVRAGPMAEVLAGAVAADSGQRFDVTSTLTARVLSHDAAFDITRVAHPAGIISLPGRIGEPGQTVRIPVRATNVMLAVGSPDGLSVRTLLTGRIESIGSGQTGDGPSTLVAITLDGGERLLASTTRLAVSELQLKPGDAVRALIKTVAIEERSVG